MRLSLVPSTAREELMILRAEKGPDGYLDAVWNERYPYEHRLSRGGWPFKRLEQARSRGKLRAVVR